jgi:hypothetical protein
MPANRIVEAIERRMASDWRVSRFLIPIWVFSIGFLRVGP